MDSIKAQVTQGYKQRLQQYEAALTVAIHQQYPLSREARQLLQRLQQEMDLSNDTVAAIEQRITAPVEAERQRNLLQYKKVFTRAIHWQYPLSDEDQEFLTNLRRVLDLSESMTQSIERQVVQGYEQKLQQYQAAFTKAIYQQYPLSHETRRQLQQLQQSLGLRQETIDPVEVHITQGYERKLQQYEAAFTKAIDQQYSLSDSDRQSLANLQGPNLTEHQVKGYEQKLQQYKETFTEAIHQHYPLSEAARQPLQQLQQNLKLEQETIESIEARVTQGYEQKLQLYETAFTRAIQRQYPLEDGDREFLANLQQSLNLSPKITDPIEELECLRRGLNLNEQETDSIETKVIQTYSSPASTVNPPASNPPQRKHQKGQPLLSRAIVVAIVLVGTSLSAHYVYTLWQADKAAKAALEQAKTLKATKNYEACLNQAKAVPQESRFYSDAQNLLNQCQGLARDQQWLAQAKVFATKNNFKDAIAQANGIQSNSSFHPEAQQLINQWSETLLKQAEGQYTRSVSPQDLEQAIDMTKAIPQNSSLAPKVEETVAKWRVEWNQNETYLQSAQSALAEGRWGEAIEKANQVKLLGQKVNQETPYWQNKVSSIIERAGELRAASSRQAETTQQSSAQQPVTQESTTQRSVNQQPVTQQSTTRQANTQPSTAQRSTTRQSSTRRSSARRSSTQRSTTQRSQSGSWPTDIR